jgi:glycosyltransferase involved in cell wall biosynthesis
MSSLQLTVVMPNYNHARYLDRVIGTVVSQTRPPDRFIILDDGSTDDSLSKINSWVDRCPAISLVRNEKNTGVIAAHQRLFEMATGDYLYPASADDELLPTFFECAMGMAERYPQAGLICGQMVIADEHARELDLVQVRNWQQPVYAPPQKFLAEYLEAEEPSHSLSASTIFRRACLEEVGWLRHELGSWSDTFAIRAIGLKYGICYVPQRFSLWRNMSQNFSAKARSDYRHMLDLVARAAYLMRHSEFRDRFPESHVQRWEQRYRRRVLKDYLRGNLSLKDAGLAARSRFFLQCLRRSFGAISLAAYRGDVSCFKR